MSGSILASKDMRAIFQKNDKKRAKKSEKRAKYFKNLGENVQNLKIF